MSYKIVKNKDFLHKKTEPVTSVEEGQEIANKLIQALDELKFGLGLSANQIGIQKSVSVIRVKKDMPPIILMNPVISEESNEKIVYVEGCVSLPGKQTKTVRSLKIQVSTLNHANVLPFGPTADPLTQDSIAKDYGVLESVCVQHEIDHLRGVLMIDDGVRFVETPLRTVKHGRNDKVMVEKDGEMQYIKYKKALHLLNEGWKIK
jgi:peptide deformylase